MSLFYPSSGSGRRGKTAEREDRFTSRFVELPPPARIVQAICFDAVDVAFTGEMTMVVTLENKYGGTEVTVLFEHIPSGTRPEDDELARSLSAMKGSRRGQGSRMKRGMTRLCRVRLADGTIQRSHGQWLGPPSRKLLK